MADAQELGGWTVDENNPNRIFRVDENGDEWEAFRDEAPKTQAPKAETPEDRGVVTQFVDAYKDAVQYGGSGLAARKWYEWSGYGRDELARQLPNMPEAEREALRIKMIGDTQERGRQEGAERTKNDSWVPWLTGQFVGGINGPEAAIGAGAATAGGRIAGMGLVNAGADIGYQTMDQVDDVQDGYRADQIVLSGLAGAGFQGASEFVQSLARLRGRDTTPAADPRDWVTQESKGQYENIIKSGTLEEANQFLDANPGLQTDREALARYFAARDSGQTVGTTVPWKAQEPAVPRDIEPSGNPDLEAQARDFQSSPEPSPEDLFGAPKAPEAPAEIANVVDDARVNQAVSYVDELTSGWENRPEIEVLRDSNQVRELHPDVDPEGMGWFNPETGKVHINMEQVDAYAKQMGVSEPEAIRAVTFHESLGHYGLAQKFGDDLGRILANMDGNSKWFSKQIDDWQKKNPDLYLDDPDPRGAAAEEVLAELSEKGAIPATVLNRFKNWIKDYGRQMGIDWDFSEREIRTILGGAHRQVIKGRRQGLVAGNLRNMYAGERSEAAPYETSPRWFEGEDGKRRYEISDQHAKLNSDEYDRLGETGDTGYLQDILDHDELFDAYPQLAYTKIKVTRVGMQNAKGGYTASTNTITLNPDYKDEAISTVLHEVQHDIQQREGFAKGGNTNRALKQAPTEWLKNKVNRLATKNEIEVRKLQKSVAFFEDLDADPAVADFVTEATNDLYRANVAFNEYYRNFDRTQGRHLWEDPEYIRLKDEIDRLRELKEAYQEDLNTYLGVDTPTAGAIVRAWKSENTRNWTTRKLKEAEDLKAYFDEAKEGDTRDLYIRAIKKETPWAGDNAYRDLLGEVEARDTQARQDMSYEERETTRPLSSEDAPEDGYIIDFQGPEFAAETVWHGTPRDDPFDNVSPDLPHGKFDLGYLGSGEGNAAYGWGLYFAQNRNISQKMYREKLSMGDVQRDKYGDPVLTSGTPFYQWVKENGPSDLGMDDLKDIRDIFNYHDPVKKIKERLADLRLELRSLRDEFDDAELAGDKADMGAIQEDIDRHRKLVEMYAGLNREVQKKGGALYEVNLPDDAKYLDWDKSLKDQLPEVKKLFAKDLMSEFGEKASELQNMNKYHQAEYDSLTNRTVTSDTEMDEVVNVITRLEDAIYSNNKKIESLKNPTGKDIYAALTKKLGNMKDASLRLRELGLTGTRYLDGLSRMEGHGTSNFVIFDDNIPKITNRYMRKPKPLGTSEGTRQGGSAKEARDGVIDKDLRMGGFRSNRPIENILNDSAPEFTKEHHDDWVNLAEKVRATTKLKPGSDAPEVLAARKRIVESGNRIYDLARRGVDMTLSPREQDMLMTEIARNAAMQEALAGVRSNAARIVNSFRIDVESDKAWAQNLRNMMANTNNTVFSNPQHQQQLLQLISQQTNPQSVNKIVKAALKPKAEDYIFRVYYNMMLSNPATHTTNFAGTAGNFIYDLLEKTGAAVIGQSGRFSNLDRVRFREVGYRVYGALRALADARTWDNTRSALNTGNVGGVSSAKTGNTNVYQGSNPVLAAASGFAEAPTRALAGADEFWRNVLQLSNLHGLAVRNAGNKGLKGKAFWAEVENQINNPTPEMIKATNDYTQVLQFMDKPSFIAEALMRAQTPGPKAGVGERVGKGALKFLVPFVRTPDALIRTAIRRSPLGYERENIKGWKAGGAARDEVKARMLMGSMLAFWVASKAMGGDITGNGPEDYQKRTAWAGSHLPNSIKIGDEYHGIAGLEPVSTNIMGIATLVERYKAGEISDESYAASAASLAQGIGSVLSENSYMENVNAFFQLLGSDPDKKGASLTNTVASLASSLTTPAILRGYARSIDPAVRNTTGDGSMGDRVEGRIKSGYTGGTEELPQKSDVYGRLMERDILGSPMYTRSETKGEETDPAIREIARLEDGSKSVVLGAPSKSGIKVDGKERKLTAEEYEQYQQLSGFWTVQLVRQMMEHEDWASASDEERIEGIKDAKNAARKQAREYLFNSASEE